MNRADAKIDLRRSGTPSGVQGVGGGSGRAPTLRVGTLEMFFDSRWRRHDKVEFFFEREKFFRGRQAISNRKPILLDTAITREKIMRSEIQLIGARESGGGGDRLERGQ
jgi:hypothetical protein